MTVWDTIKETTRKIVSRVPFSPAAPTDMGPYPYSFDPVVEALQMKEEGEKDVQRKALLKQTWMHFPYGRMRTIDVDTLRKLAESFWVSRCITTILDVICAIKWIIVPVNKDEDHKKMCEKITAFLHYPGSEETTNFKQLIKKWGRDILEIDAAIGVKNFSIKCYEEVNGQNMLRVDTPPDNLREIQTFDSYLFLKHIDQNNVLRGYWQYNYVSKRPTYFSKREIMFLEKNPSSYGFYGLSPIMTIQAVIETLIASVTQTKEFYEKGAIPQGVLVIGDIGETDYNKFTHYWKTKIQGKAWKLPLVKIKNGDLKFVPFNPNEKDVRFLDGLDFYQKLVMSVFHVTPHELGITDSVNKASAEQQSLVFKRKSIRPMLALFADTFNTHIIPEFDPDRKVGFEWTIEPDLDEKIKEETVNSTATESGYLTINEIRKLKGQDPVDFGEVPAALLKQGVFTPDQAMRMSEQSEMFTGFPFPDEEPDNEEEEEPEGEKVEPEEESVSRSPPRYLVKQNPELKKAMTDEEFEERAKMLQKQITVIEKSLEKGIKSYFSIIIKALASIDNNFFVGRDPEEVADHLVNLLNEEDFTKIIQTNLSEAYRLGMFSVDEEVKETDKSVLQNIKYIVQYGRIVSRKLIKNIQESLRFQIHDLFSKGFGPSKVLLESRRTVYAFAKRMAPVTAATSTYNAVNIGRINKLQSYNFKSWVFHTMEDEKVCPDCKAQHGKHYSFENLRHKPPLHPNCRCFVKPSSQSTIDEYVQPGTNTTRGTRPDLEDFTPVMAAIEMQFEKSINEVLTELRDKGKNTREIGSLFEVSHVTVADMLKRCKL